MTEPFAGKRWPEDTPDPAGAGLAGLAHDLKSWVTPARTCLQLWECGELDKAAELRATALQNLDTILACLEHLRQHAPSPDAALSPVRLGPLAQRALDLCQAALREKNLRAELRATPQDTLAGDEWLLLRLLTNLLSNAAHAAPAGSCIVLALSNTPAPAPALVLSVQNTVSPSKDATVENAARGGLGLRICREIAALHRGRLDFHCGPAVDLLTVTVTLPQA